MVTSFDSGEPSRGESVSGLSSARKVGDRLARDLRPNMDLVTALRGYLERMFTEVSGMKALLFDRDTCRMVSMVYEQHELLQKEAFLSDFLDNVADREPKPFLKAVVVVLSLIHI